MSRAVKTVLLETSRLPEKATTVVAVIGIGLTAVWWSGRNEIESNRPVPSPAVVQTRQAVPIRPEKDDVLAILPQAPKPEAQAKVAAAAVPVPIILRKEAHEVKQPPVTRYDRCRPACESRDPLVLSNLVPPKGVTSFADNYDDGAAVVVEQSSVAEAALERGGRLLSGATNVSRRALGVGRSAVVAIVDVIR
jgi:hypothetical protein